MNPKLLLGAFVACLAFAGCEGPGGDDDEDVFGGRDGSFVWKLEEGILTIEGGMRDYNGSSESAPWYEHWFSIEEVVIADGVPRIGSYAFYRCENLTKISIPASVEQIGECAFTFCPNLTGFNVAAGNPVFSSADGVLFADGGTRLVTYPSVSGNYTIPAGVEHIEAWAFAGYTDLTGITIPGTVESIGDCAFYGCSSLESITIETGVKTIGSSAFDADSPHITSLVIPDSVESIGDLALDAGPNLESLSAPGIASSLSIGILPVTELTFTSGIVTGNADVSYFKDFPNLKTVILTEGVTEIGWYAFANCRELETITIPASATSVDEISAFEDCLSLERIDVAAGNPNYKSVDGVLFNKAGTTLLFYPLGNPRENYTIPNGVTTLPGEVLNGLPLRTLTIPTSMSQIGSNVFGNWQFMESVYIHATTPPGMGMQHYFGVFGITPTLYVPVGCVNIYENAYPWGTYFENRITEQ